MLDGADHIDLVTRQIIDLFGPQKIYLYNRKTSPNGAVSSFKLCVVMDIRDKGDAEREIYRSVECDIPFDVLLYTPEEWEEYRQRVHAFAQKIDQTGKILYG